MKPFSIRLAGLALAALAVHSTPGLEAATDGDAQKYNPESKAVSPAPILVQKVRGSVSAVSLRNGESFPLQDGAKLQQGVTIQTGKDSRANLVFSNGAVVAVTSESKLKIIRFEQAGGIDMDLSPIHHDGKAVAGSTTRPMGTYDKEPSISYTDLFLVEGTAYARVKKLHRKSTYHLRTPLGATQVLGTAWRQTNHTSPSELKTVSTVQLHSGSVDFSLINQKPSDKPIKVKPGQQLTITGTFASLKDIATLVQAESLLNIDASIVGSIDLSIESAVIPIEDTTFEPSLNDFLPPDIEQDVTLLAPDIGNIAEIDTNPFFTGDQSIVTSGAFGGGGGGGGGDTSFPTPTPEPTPTPPAPTPTPPIPPS